MRFEVEDELRSSNVVRENGDGLGVLAGGDLAGGLRGHCNRKHPSVNHFLRVSHSYTTDPSL